MAMHAHSTPCPPPRRGIEFSPSALMPTISELSIDVSRPGRSLLDVKPRRPKNSRRSLAWDPTIDIYEDTAALPQVAPMSDVPQLGAPMQSREYQRGAGLLGRAPQRFSNGPLDVNGANIKKRRTSSTAQPPQEVQLSVDAAKPSEISREARRRTIYVPSEDTTMLTIHPGAPSRNKVTQLRRPRRSDIFLDLAALSETSDDPPKSPQRSLVSPTRTLETAPPRRPLQQSVRQLQGSAFPEDILGSGGGKENIPPGMLLGINKPKEIDAVPLQKTVANTRSFANAQSFQSPGHRTLPINQPVKSPPIGTIGAHQLIDRVMDLKGSQHSPRCSPKSVLGAAGIGVHRVPMHKKSILVPSPAPAPAPAPAPRRTESTPLRLKIPLLLPGRHQRLQQYPVLSDDITRPELYQENWIAQQEEAITQLLNSLYETSVEGLSDCSTPYGSLRQLFVHHYINPSTVLLHKRLQASLRFGALSISKDTLSRVTRIKEDLGQRQKFLDLWLKTYHISILQAAAETVIGREILGPSRISGSPCTKDSGKSPRHSIRQIERFLLAFLVRNEDEKSSGQSNSSSPKDTSTLPDGLNDVGSTAWAWRRITTRSLMMILLIDRAAAARQLNRCIFQVSSPCKSSSAVLQALSCLLLPSIGDVSRVLGHMFYQLGHVQYPLQEYNYHVDNLATDLRDGVRLTRLVEVLLYPPTTLALQKQDVTVTLPSGDTLSSANESDDGQNWVLSQHLKYPCTSRVQKLYNVQIALSALAGVKDINSMLDGIEATDIVDGHREKTVGLLWSIVVRWGLGTLLDFELVEKEIVRLRKAWWARESSKSGYYRGISSEAEDAAKHLPHLEGLELQTRLLHSWARHVARLHGVTVSNLSTSFADGAAYRSIAEEYSAHRNSTSSIVTAASTTQFTSQTFSVQDDLQASFTGTLRSMGCSRAFIKLFQNTQTITSAQTTIPLLAFLASRFLPASRPHFAAMVVQRAWRRHLARKEGRKKFALAVLARDCALVVRTREEIVGAAVKVQRWWRSVRS